MVLADYLDVPAGELQSERTLEDLGADSLDFLQIAFAIEEKFGITIEGDGAELRAKLHSIGDVIAVVSEIVAQKRASPPP